MCHCRIELEISHDKHCAEFFETDVITAPNTTTTTLIITRASLKNLYQCTVEDVEDVECLVVRYVLLTMLAIDILSIASANAILITIAISDAFNHFCAANCCAFMPEVQIRTVWIQISDMSADIWSSNQL